MAGNENKVTGGSNKTATTKNKNKKSPKILKKAWRHIWSFSVLWLIVSSVLFACDVTLKRILVHLRSLILLLVESQALAAWLESGHTALTL